MLEKGRLGCGQTGMSGAMIRPLFVVPAYVKLVLESTRMFENWSDEVGGSAGFVQDGFLRLTSSLAPAELGGDLEMMRSLKAPFECIRGEDLAAYYPKARFGDAEHGLFFPKGGYADPVRTTASLADAARNAGVEIREGVSVTGIRASGGCIENVTTAQEVIHTRIVVNCAGAWAHRLAASVGIDLPITVHRQPTCLLGRQGLIETGGPIWSDSVHRVYFRELGSEVIRAAPFGWTQDPVDPDSFDETISPVTMQAIQEPLSRRFDTQRTISYGGFSAVYDMTPDGHPIIGQVGGVRGFWCNCGWSGNGFASAPALGRHLAAMILGREPDVDLSTFAWPRPAGVARMVY
jgi:glycine/D-amino acid oxidase-like deaminating enzyme